MISIISWEFIKKIVFLSISSLGIEKEHSFYAAMYRHSERDVITLRCTLPPPRSERDVHQRDTNDGDNGIPTTCKRQFTVALLLRMVVGGPWQGTIYDSILSSSRILSPSDPNTILLPG